MGEVDFAVEGGHLLLVVQQFLAVDLLHVAVLVVQPLYLSLCLLEGQRLVEKVSLELLVLLDDPGGVHFVLAFDLVHFYVPQGFYFYLLLVELRGDFPARAVAVEDGHLVLLVLIFEVFIERLDVLVESVHIPL